MTNIFSKYLSLICLLTFLGGCVSIPGTNKRVLMLVNEKQEMTMGLQAYNQILQSERLSRNTRLNRILQRVGRRVSVHAPVKHYKWEFKLIENKQMNAFCLPGGKVAFYTGIMPIAQNEASLAIVMGHEIAHAVARHGGQRMSHAMLTQFGMTALDATLLQKSRYRNSMMAALGLGVQVGHNLPFSRGNELEADTMGLAYAAKAGYDPREAANFWRRFSTVGQGSAPPAFLSTHPSGPQRIANIERLIPKVIGHYNSSAKYGLGEKL